MSTETADKQANPVPSVRQLKAKVTRLTNRLNKSQHALAAELAETNILRDQLREADTKHDETAAAHSKELASLKAAHAKELESLKTLHANLIHSIENTHKRALDAANATTLAQKTATDRADKLCSDWEDLAEQQSVTITRHQFREAQLNAKLEELKIIAAEAIGQMNLMLERREAKDPTNSTQKRIDALRTLHTPTTPTK